MKNTVKLNESQLKKMIAESVKKALNEISIDTLQRAQDKAFDDMMQNWNDGEIRTKRNRQWHEFAKAAEKKEQEEMDSICPQVPKSELKNMPPDTYVIMDGRGRDFYANFIYTYSGRAGTEEQCKKFVDKFYDKEADWEFLPNIIPLETYLKRYSK